MVGVPPRDVLRSLGSAGMGRLLGGAPGTPLEPGKDLEVPVSMSGRYRGLYCSTLPLNMLGPTNSLRKVTQ